MQSHASIAVSRGNVVLTRFPFPDVTGASLRPVVGVSQGHIGQDLVLIAIASIVRGALAATDSVISSNRAGTPWGSLREAACPLSDGLPCGSLRAPRSGVHIGATQAVVHHPRPTTCFACIGAETRSCVGFALGDEGRYCGVRARGYGCLQQK
jgi:hypothetical protein